MNNVCGAMMAMIDVAKENRKRKRGARSGKCATSERYPRMHWTAVGGSCRMDGQYITCTPLYLWEQNATGSMFVVASGRCTSHSMLLSDCGLRRKTGAKDVEVEWPSCGSASSSSQLGVVRIDICLEATCNKLLTCHGE